MSNGSTQAPHRDAPITISLEDYEKATEELASIRAKLDAMERANARSLRWAQWLRSLFAWLLTAAAICAVCWGFWWVALRGRANGTRARHNAEVEAMKYITATRGTAPLAVMCVDTLSGSGEFTILCIPRPPIGNNLYCDPDEPSRNDGCMESGR
jgi:hypothetical protein